MKSIIKRSPFDHRVIVALSAIVTLFFGIISLAAQVYAASEEPPTPAAGEHLVTIHDNGKDRGILTKATTLRQAFESAGIRIDPNDRVEPGLDVPLIASNYEVNVYRARPVTIVDGTVRVKVMSAYQTPQQITEQAGVELHDEDTATLSTTEDIVAEGTGLKLSIDRATPFTFVLYGKAATAYTQEKTVGEMLAKKNVTLGANDTLSVPVSTPITAGMTVELWRNGVQTVTEEQEIPFEVEKIQDKDRDIGYKEVKTPGEKGKKTVTFEIEMKNGQEISRKEIQSVVSNEPKKQVEIVGAKTKSFGGNCAEWMAGAGITDLANANYLVGEESGCNPYAVNKSSGACGIGQEYPCGKSGCELGNGACQMRWMNEYVLGRYGSWANAAEKHRTSGWY